ncbi:MAG: inositol monophosphatase family protein [Actinomycetota bacterium]
MDERVLSDDLAFALHLADVAAEITMTRFGSRMPVELKEDATPVTAVDLAAERAIRKAVAATFPNDAVRGEEEGLDDGSSGRVWVVDPVDGTKLFAEGIPLWTTLIALREGDRTVVGIADAPALGGRYSATKGGGAWKGDRRIEVSGIGSLGDAFVAHSALEEWIAGGREGALRRIVTTARRTRGLSDAWGHLLVAQGSVDALVEHEPCYEWDWAATGLIVEEAGGRLSTFAGDAPTPGQNLVVSNGFVHDEVLAALND